MRYVDFSVNNVGADLNWAELAELQIRADKGDIPARVYLDSMPAGARKNAELIVKSYKGDRKKADRPDKKRKPKMATKALAEPVLTKAERTQGMMLRSIERLTVSDSPAEREMAKTYLRELGL